MMQEAGGRRQEAEVGGDRRKAVMLTLPYFTYLLTLLTYLLTYLLTRRIC